ncbi:Wzz/FepE/Etk N-terminal domain-containing protein [Bacillus gobiensis]|uniref:YveK family protein n=1 Tax=Bacillus gobiensis TaxID=1441095 RepID=UPI003D193A59
MEQTISLKEIFLILRKRLALIVLVTFAATLLSFFVNYFYLTPTYQASTQLLVSQTRSDEPRFDYNEIQTNLELINTYSVIIKSPVILEKVKEDLNLDESVDSLNSMITVSSENESQVIRLSVESSNFEQATEIANKVGEVFQAEVKNIMNIDNVSVLSEAQQDSNPVPVSPRRTLNIAIAFIVGLMAGVGLTFILEYFDNTIKSENEIETLLKVPVLGLVSNVSKKSISEDKIDRPTANVVKESGNVI